MADGSSQDIAEERTGIRGKTARRLRRIEYLLAGILIVLFFWSISLAKVVIMPLVLGLLIALTLSPAVRALEKLRIPPVVSAIALILTIGGVTAAGLYLLSGPAGSLLDEVPRIRTELREKAATWENELRQISEASEEMEQIAAGNTGDDDEEGERIVVNGDRPTFINMAVSSLAGMGSSVAIAMVLALFLLSAGDMYQRKLVEALPTLSDKKRALTISHDIERQISRYLGAITVINACLGIAVGTVLHLLDMPYAHLWGVGAFLLNYLPFVGAMIGVIACTAVSLVTFETVGQAMIPPLGYVTLTSIEGQVLTPWLVGRHLKLNAAVVFVAVVFWAWLWGVAGALMAVPFLVFLKVVCDNVPALQVFGTFLAGRDDPMAVTGPPVGSGGAR
ncbi:MAG: AI-2E family transporter [Pseudooceanicola sp.]